MKFGLEDSQNIMKFYPSTEKKQMELSKNARFIHFQGKIYIWSDYFLLFLGKFEYFYRGKKERERI